MPEQQTAPKGHWPRVALISGLLYGLPMGVFFSIQSGRYSIGMLSGMVAGVFFGVFFGWFMSWFGRRQSSRFKFERPDFGNEKVLIEGPANHIMGAEGVGGYLWLTDGRLHFASHKVNIQNHKWSAPLRDVEEVETVKTLGIIANGLLVRLKSGENHRFVVHNNAAWAEAILKSRKHAT